MPRVPVRQWVLTVPIGLRFGLEGAEAELLDWLAQAWNVKIEIADDAGG